MSNDLFPTGGNVRLFNGDCFEVMQTFPETSVDLVLTDPPYGTMAGFACGVQDYGGSGWRNKVDKWDKESLDIDQTKAAMARVLKPKCRALLFAQEPYTSALVQHFPPRGMNFVYRMLWLKNETGNALISKISPVNLFEDIVCFERSYSLYEDSHSHPLRPYAKELQAFIGRTAVELKRDLGNSRAEHFINCHATIQFSLCTAKTYDDLIETYKIDTWEGFRPFADLKADDAKYWEEINPPTNKFHLPPGEKQVRNVLQYPKDSERLHPTQKPVALLQRLITLFTEPDDIVLDFTMGSGSTGVAAVMAGRRFVGIERDPDYFKIARNRLERNLFLKIEE